MKITKETVRNLAHLARLNMSIDDEAQMVDELEKIFGLFDVLREVSVDDIEPTFHAVSEQSPLRDDAVEPSLAVDVVASLAPDWDDGFFHVPIVLDKGH